MFKLISDISDIQAAVSHKKEIKFLSQPNGTTVACYLFMDSKTFDSPEALECRGTVFDSSGKVVSRPLHKFFNIGEKEWLSPEKLLGRQDIVAIYEKLDGSMIATAWINGELKLRSKKSFNSKVVELADKFLNLPENALIKSFCTSVAENGMTAIFELTHPDARIVVDYKDAQLTLLHIRDNATGQYVLINSPTINKLVSINGIKRVNIIDKLTLQEALKNLEDMKNQEGYVIQFANGDMVKVKCPWYLKIHTAISYMRERDIAKLALAEQLDDVKGHLTEIGIDMAEVNKVEEKLNKILSAMIDEIEEAYEKGKDLDRKSFAIANKDSPLFGLIMQRYLGKELDLSDWYSRNRLKEDFSLRMLGNEALEEALEE